MGTLTSFISVFILQLILFQYDFEKTKIFFIELTRLNLLQTAVVFVFFIWIYSLTISFKISFLIIILLSTLIGIASEQKILYRLEPLYPSDIYFIKDYKMLLETVDTSVIIKLSVLLLILFIGILLYYKKRKRTTLSKILKITRLLSIFVTTLLILYINQFNQPGNKIKGAFNNYANWITFSQEANYSKNGMISGLLYNLKSSAIERPNDYSEKKIADLYEKYSNLANGINKARLGGLNEYNLIFVMNETFSDPMRLEGISISKDPIPFYRRYASEHIAGMILSQGYGGGTANIEFEAISGVSMEPLAANITTPFIQLSDQMGELPNIVNFLKQTGHSLTTVHSYDSSMYKRVDNYSAFGFETLLFEKDFQTAERIENNPFISDKSSYNEVINRMSKTENKDFIHLVTMHNHLPVNNNYNNIDIEVNGATNNSEIAHYAKGIQYSDRDLEDFLEVIENMNEKTIVVFWGDHLPGIYDEIVYRENGDRIMHETPLFFYSNFQKESRDIGTISPIYLINHVLEITNSPITPYVALLNSLEEALPAFEKGIYLERETGLKSSREELKPSTQLLLEEYETILYDITTGKNYSKKFGFY